MVGVCPRRFQDIFQPLMAISHQRFLECSVDIDATTLLFAEANRESSLFTAYQSFNNRPIRQSMRIPDDIWHALEPAIKEKVNTIRAKVRAEREAKAGPAEGRAATGGGIPAQYPKMAK